MSKISTFLAFALGVAVGSFATYKLVKEKYERILTEETNSMREHLRNRGVETDIPEEEKTTAHKEDLSKYAEALNKLGYNPERKESENMNNIPKEPYVISPDSFGEIEGYETCSLTYYSDGTLTDEFDEAILDIDGTVGEDSLTHFGEYEDDSVFVRNDELRIDYEILRDQIPYTRADNTDE